MKTNRQHLQALRNYIDDPTALDSLKLEILSWMWDNRQKIATPKAQDDQFQFEVETFTKLIMKRDI